MWQPFKEATAMNGTNPTAVLVDAIRAYLRKPEPTGATARLDDVDSARALLNEASAVDADWTREQLLAEAGVCATLGVVQELRQLRRHR